MLSFFLLLLFGTVMSQHTRVESECFSFENELAQFDLILFPTAEEMLNFDDSDSFCSNTKQDSRLAVVKTVEENNILINLIEENQDLILDLQLWIGFHDPTLGETNLEPDDPERFVSVDENVIFEFYQVEEVPPWRDVAPRRNGDRHCVNIESADDTFLWDNSNCEQTLDFVCRSPCSSSNSSDIGGVVVLLFVGILSTVLLFGFLFRRHLNEKLARGAKALTGYDAKPSGTLAKAGRNLSLERDDSVPTAVVPAILRSGSNIGSETKRLSVASTLTSLTAKSFKSTISREDRKNHQRIKAHSFAQSTVLSEVSDAVSDVVSEITFTSVDANITPRVVDKVMPVIELKIQAPLTSLQAIGLLRIFHNNEIPDISLRDYLIRLCEGLNLWFYEDIETSEIGPRALFLSLLYLKRLQALHSKFQLTDYNKHRVFAILLLVAVKFSEDETITNNYWSNVSGLSLEEVNDLEAALCLELKFDFALDNEELKKLLALIKRHIKEK